MSAAPKFKSLQEPCKPNVQQKGIFITTSDFTSEAKEFAKNIEAKIILISGKQLAELMYEHNVGVSISVTYEIKKLDSDFFVE